MSRMQLRSETERYLNAFITRQQRVLNALPDLDTIQVDRALIFSLDSELTGLCYSYFPGREHGAPCSLICVALDPSRLRTERWRWEAPPKIDRFDTVMYCALNETAKRLGFSTKTGNKMAKDLQPFAINRGPKTYIRERFPKSTPDQARVGKAIGLCLAHVLDPSSSFAVRAYYQESAQAPRRLRSTSGYREAHERSLRKIA